MGPVQHGPVQREWLCADCGSPEPAGPGPGPPAGPGPLHRMVTSRRGPGPRGRATRRAADSLRAGQQPGSEAQPVARSLSESLRVSLARPRRRTGGGLLGLGWPSPGPRVAAGTVTGKLATDAALCTGPVWQRARRARDGRDGLDEARFPHPGPPSLRAAPAAAASRAPAARRTAITPRSIARAASASKPSPSQSPRRRLHSQAAPRASRACRPTGLRCQSPGSLFCAGAGLGRSPAAGSSASSSE